MTELLEKAVAAVEKLPVTDQDRYAAVLLAELEAELDRRELSDKETEA